MNNEQKIQELHPEVDFIFLNGFDDSLLGTAWSNGELVTCYSIKSMVNNLVKNQGMTERGAKDWLDHNTLYSHFGDITPIYVDELKGEIV